MQTEDFRDVIEFSEINQAFKVVAAEILQGNPGDPFEYASKRLVDIIEERLGVQSEQEIDRDKYVHEKESAARRIQAVHRGNRSRKRVEALREERNQGAAEAKAKTEALAHAQAKAKAEAEAKAQEGAAIGIQRVQRGKVARKKVKQRRQQREKEAEEKSEQRAATRIQRQHRGGQARKRVMQMRIDREQQELIKQKERENRAATRIQSRHRGGRVSSVPGCMQRFDVLSPPTSSW